MMVEKEMIRIGVADEVVNRLVKSHGHDPGDNPLRAWHWKGDELIIDEYPLVNVKAGQWGHILEEVPYRFQIKGIAIERDKIILKGSLGGIGGVSRGPMLLQGTGEFIGLMSFKEVTNQNQFVIRSPSFVFLTKSLDHDLQ